MKTNPLNLVSGWMNTPRVSDLQAENQQLRRSRSFWRWAFVFLLVAFFITCHLR